MGYYQRKRFKKRLRIAALLLVFGCAAFLSTLYFNRFVSPQVEKATNASLHSRAYLMLNEAVYNTLTENPSYAILADVTSDNEGRATLITHKHLEINMFALKTMQGFIQRLEQEGESGVQIPIGAFTGISIFSAQGAMVNVKYKPFGSASCRIITEFISAGINQTSHKIYFSITAEVHSLVPSVNDLITIEQTILVSENIIIGDVPSFYMGSKTLGELAI